ncbi:Hypothetical protein NTJ_06882 [Nesidiocoris tenuis]|nr:Hypothetical protein NTJ_06882 [Nesidiocoris tenuis]
MISLPETSKVFRYRRHSTTDWGSLVTNSRRQLKPPPPVDTCHSCRTTRPADIWTLGRVHRRDLNGLLTQSAPAVYLA